MQIDERAASELPNKPLKLTAGLVVVHAAENIASVVPFYRPQLTARPLGRRANIGVDADEIYAQLCALAGSGRKVRLTRDRPSETHKNGFIIAVSPVLIVLEQFHDFYAEGYTAILTRDITHVRSGEHERFWERMFRAEGIAAAGELPHQLRFDDLPALLAGLAACEENVIVECEEADEDVKDFYIGRVVEVADGRVAFSNFDALGRWDPETVDLAVDDITQVEFRTPYLTIFSKHLEGPCPHV